MGYYDEEPPIKGMNICPCFVPKCPQIYKCTEDATMCLSFEEWAGRGAYKAQRGKWLVPIEDHHFESKHSGAAKRSKKLYFDKVYKMYKSGTSKQGIASKFCITIKSVSMIILRQGRLDKEKNNANV